MLNPQENALADKIRRLKRESGTHSPSIYTLLSEIHDLKIKIDACFLSNPFATDLFMKYFTKDLIETQEIRKVLEFYPSQNQSLASTLSPLLNVPSENIFLGNGATEIIQALLHRFAKKKMLINLPTFSPYYEFARPDVEVLFNTLSKHQDFRLDKSPFLDLIRQHRPDTVVIINPNNPDGGYIPKSMLNSLLGELTAVDNVIVDESFVHFAYEEGSDALISNHDLFMRFPNVSLVKSMSKDFGIAGIRAGYAVMAKEKVKELLKNGYLWNISGLAEYFFRLFIKDEFQKSYEPLRLRHIRATKDFFKLLNAIPEIKVYPSKSNFFLMEVINGQTSDDVALELLLRHGIYTRSCNDKKGLEGQFIRVASRSEEENAAIIHALKEVLQTVKV